MYIVWSVYNRLDRIKHIFYINLKGNLKNNKKCLIFFINFLIPVQSNKPKFNSFAQFGFNSVDKLF